MAGIQKVLNIQGEYFRSGITKDLTYRIDCLKKLKSEIIKHEEEIITAMKNDLNKPPFEVYTTEIGMVPAGNQSYLCNIICGMIELYNTGEAKYLAFLST